MHCSEIAVLVKFRIRTSHVCVEFGPICGTDRRGSDLLLHTVDPEVQALKMGRVTHLTASRRALALTYIVLFENFARDFT